MNSQPVPDSLRNLLADTFGISPHEVTPELSSETLEVWDSFAHLQAILALEGEYGVQFDPQRIPELTSVAKIQTALASKGVTL
jgi:acyl carrier protein